MQTESPNEQKTNNPTVNLLWCVCEEGQVEEEIAWLAATHGVTAVEALVAGAVADG
jgi:hypothetical protein